MYENVQNEWKCMKMYEMYGMYKNERNVQKCMKMHENIWKYAKCTKMSKMYELVQNLWKCTKINIAKFKFMKAYKNIQNKCSEEVGWIISNHCKFVQYLHGMHIFSILHRWTWKYIFSAIFRKYHQLL